MRSCLNCKRCAGAEAYYKGEGISLYCLFRRLNIDPNEAEKIALKCKDFLPVKEDVRIEKPTKRSIRKRK